MTWLLQNIHDAIDPQYKPSKGYFHRIRTNRRGQRTIGKGRPRRNNDNRRQPDLSLRQPFPKSAAVRPKLKLLPRIVKEPMNTVVHTEKNASIFGTEKPCESSLVNKTKRTHTRNWIRAC